MKPYFDQNEDYTRECEYCGEQIIMHRHELGHWVALNVGFGGSHPCMLEHAKYHPHSHTQKLACPEQDRFHPPVMWEPLNGKVMKIVPYGHPRIKELWKVDLLYFLKEGPHKGRHLTRIAVDKQLPVGSQIQGKVIQKADVGTFLDGAHLAMSD